MSRDFTGGLGGGAPSAGSPRVIEATITPVDTGDWTMGIWAYPVTAGEGGFGGFISTGATSSSTQFLRISGSRRIQAHQEFGSTDVDSESPNSTLALNVWQVIFGIFRAADQKCRLYIGSLVTPVAETTYNSQITGTGSRKTGATALQIGNRATYDRTFDGYLYAPFLVARELTIPQMEQYRLGSRRMAGNPAIRGFWPLDSPNANQTEDISPLAAHGTPQGVFTFDNPPVPWPHLSYQVGVVLGVPATNHPLAGTTRGQTNLKSAVGTPQLLTGRTVAHSTLLSNLNGAQHHLEARTYPNTRLRPSSGLSSNALITDSKISTVTRLVAPLTVAHSLVGRTRTSTLNRGILNLPPIKFIIQPTRLIPHNNRTALTIEHRS